MKSLFTKVLVGAGVVAFGATAGWNMGTAKSEEAQTVPAATYAGPLGDDYGTKLYYTSLPNGLECGVISRSGTPSISCAFPHAK